MKPRLVERTVFVPSPGPGQGVMGGSFYTKIDSDELLSIHVITTRADTADRTYVRRSLDNGATWSATETISCGEQRPDGTWRRHDRCGYLDAATGTFMALRNEGLLPTDEPLEGMRQWKVYAAVSADGGRTVLYDEPIVHDGVDDVGVAFDADHPLPGVWRGRTSVMLGDFTCTPITAEDGTILIPCQLAPVGADGAYDNKGGGLTFHDSAVLHGTWADGRRLRWRMSARVIGDPARSTRGFLEPTIAQLAPGRVLMVMRGSNDVRHELPGHRWYALSNDGGMSWDEARPWTYTSGEAFHSPSACSQLLEHSSGRLYWLGNICRDNPRGNRPRYPMVIGEVDRDSGLLHEQSVLVIDDRAPGERERLTLSNFYAREDRRSGEIVLSLPRFFATGDTFETDNYQYRIAVDATTGATRSGR